MLSDVFFKKLDKKYISGLTEVGHNLHEKNRTSKIVKKIHVIIKTHIALLVLVLL